MRILITGSRTWTNLTILHEAILAQAGHAGSDVVIIHGGASGVDTAAHLFAKKQGFTVEVYPAQWEKFGKRAGFIRNKEMVDAGADICLAFIHNSSKGATMCAKLAEEAGITVKYWRE